MPSAVYFHRQADICLRLALIASDEEVSNRLILTAKGAALGRQSGGDAPPHRVGTRIARAGGRDKPRHSG